MTSVSVARVVSKIDEIMRRVDADDFDALDEFNQLIEPRRLADGQLIWVPRGAPINLNDISHDLILSHIPFSEVIRPAD